VGIDSERIVKCFWGVNSVKWRQREGKEYAISPVRTAVLSKDYFQAIIKELLLGPVWSI
jgi:hypothetical protein